MQKLVSSIIQHEDTGVKVGKAYSFREGGYRYITKTLGLQVLRTIEYSTFEFPPGVKVMANLLHELGES